MKYKLVETTRFRKDIKKILKRDASNFRLVTSVLYILRDEGVAGIPKKMRAHKLKGNYEDNWECHIKPDLLII